MTLGKHEGFSKLNSEMTRALTLKMSFDHGAKYQIPHSHWMERFHIG